MGFKEDQTLLQAVLMDIINLINIVYENEIQERGKDSRVKQFHDRVLWTIKEVGNLPRDIDKEMYDKQRKYRQDLPPYKGIN